MRGYRGTLLAAWVLLLAASRHAGAQEGLYAGVAAGWDRANADYTKGIGLDVPPPSYETATNDAQGGFGTVRASLGYRTFVAGRVYVSGEFEAAFHGGAGPADRLSLNPPTRARPGLHAWSRPFAPARASPLIGRRWRTAATRADRRDGDAVLFPLPGWKNQPGATPRRA